MFQRPAATQRISYVLRKDENRNAHLLGVNALALDSTTLTVKGRNGHGVPGGILYTGGRDGMIAAWDLHLEAPVHRGIPGETTDHPKGLPPSTFRQSFNHHTDWINDIVLCHNGETLVSASSDRTIKLVRPHSHAPAAAYIVGTHEDYVKTLAHASGPGWIASGGLDKTVRLWDIKEGRGGHFTSIGSIPETSSKASVYALACNPAGTVLATGSPEKIIRVWDPRSGQRITKFTGHTDNIRALLISESGDTILSASSDTTIKLWSLTAQRCITTFTMHSDSVWSLYSEHPELSTFYGGGKDGLVTKTEVNRYSPQHNGYDDGDSGQCVVICKADVGVARLVAHDNARIWTATSSSSVYQWPDIPTRVNRSEELAASIIPANLLKMNLNETTFADSVPDHYYPTSTVYSAASLGSLFVGSKGDKQSQHSSEDDEGLIAPVFDAPENIIHGEHGLIKHAVLNNRRMVVTEDKCGEIAVWDLIKCVQLQTFTGRKLEDVVNELNTVESVPTWCTIDTRIGALTVHLDEGRCFDAEVYCDEVEEVPHPERPEDQRVIIGKWVLKNLFDSYVPVHIEAYEKELYRQQHLDDPPTSTAAGSTLLVPTTVITNERNEVVVPSGAGSHPDNGNNNSNTLMSTLVNNGRPTINTSPEGLQSSDAADTNPSPLTGGTKTASPQDNTTRPGHSPKQSPSAAPSSTKSLAASPSVPTTPTSFSPTVGSSNSSVSNGFMGRLKHSVKKLARTPSAEQRFENGRPVSSRKGFGQSPTVANITIPSGSQTPQALNSPALSDQNGPPSTTVMVNTPTLPTISGTSGGGGATAVVGGSKTAATGNASLGVTKTDDEQSTSDTTSSHSLDSMPSSLVQLPPSTISIRPPHPPFMPPTVLDCPTTVLPRHIPVVISEQSREASSSVDLYRGSVGSLAHDYIPLVQIMPNWVLEVLLKNTIPLKEAAKVSFVLRPHHDQEGERGPVRLSELPGGNPRLTAPRMLRVRKVMGHVAEKLNLSPPNWMAMEVANARAAAVAAAAAAAVASGTTSFTVVNGETLNLTTPLHSRQSQMLEPVQEEEAGCQQGAGQTVPITTTSSTTTITTTTTNPTTTTTTKTSTASATDSRSASVSIVGTPNSTAPSTPALSSSLSTLERTNISDPNSSSSASSSSSSCSATTTTTTTTATTTPIIHTMTPEEEEQARLRDEQQEEEAHLREQALRPENWLEILCNDHVLPATMTLATIRSHYWKTSSDVVLTYRYRMAGAVTTTVLNAATIGGDVARSSTPVSTS
ncbi:hypothetical protein BG004_006207 [Podila humilis]|nr:hypothetical protein BG004_006207 [Podila humilis]